MAHISIGPEFFTKAKNDYANWGWALIREFIQNSVDCGSKRIAIDVEYDCLGVGQTKLSVANDGEAMTKDILVGKLLSLGASGKDFAGSVGGFGKAKEILYFCWDRYTIYTGNMLVEGSGAEYELKKAKKINGTISTVWIRGLHTDRLMAQVRTYLSLAQLDVSFTLNGENISASLHKGYFRREMSCGRLYTNRKVSNLMVVRVNGTPMFTIHIPFKGCVVLELDGTSASNLTSNRDGLRWEQRQEVDEFVRDLSVNKRKALETPKVVYRRYPGSRLGQRGRGSLQATVDKLNGQASGGQASFQAATRIEEAANSLAHEMIVKNETGKAVKPQFQPDSEKFGQYAEKIIGIWSRLLVKLHELYGMKAEFSVGFLFTDSTTIAQYEETDEYGVVYYINPVKSDGTKRYKYSPRNRDELNSLAIVALHELVHGMGYMDHDENYSSQLTEAAGKLLSHGPELAECYFPELCKRRRAKRATKK
jgi:hypothetical protein